MMGCDGMDGILGVEGFDTSLAEGLLLMTPFSADDEKNADFVNAYKDKYGDTPDQFAADATTACTRWPRPQGGRSWCRRRPDRGLREAAQGYAQDYR